jgi:hypothetical protein
MAVALRWDWARALRVALSTTSSLRCVPPALGGDPRDGGSNPIIAQGMGDGKKKRRVPKGDTCLQDPT